MRIGALRRRGRILIPRGDTVIESNDRIVIFATKENVPEVEQLFRVSLDYF